MDSSRTERLGVPSELLKCQIELKKKDQDIRELTLMISHKQEIFKKILNEIKRIKVGIPVSNTQLSKLIGDISLQLQNSSTEEFDIQKIKEINANYIRELVEKYPTLTKGEVDLCCMIHIGLLSKEVAAIKNISSESVRKYRQRLRKKLDIPREQNLAAFLRDI